MNVANALFAQLMLSKFFRDSCVFGGTPSHAWGFSSAGTPTLRDQAFGIS
jgi:hypothetical protein